MKPEKTDRRGTPPGCATIDAKSVGGAGGRIGNPPFVPTEQMRSDVRTWIKITDAASIALKLGISRDTLDRHFKKELAEGRFEAVAHIGGHLLKKAMSGNLDAQKFYLRTQGKWNARVEHTGADGGAIRHIDLSSALGKYSDEQLALLEPILEQLLTAGGSGLDSGDQLGAPADPGGEEPEGA